MTDRELLELAAKAAGIKLTWGPTFMLNGEEIDCTDIPYIKSGQSDVGEYYWNPLAEDGDALRLAVTLNMSIEISEYEASTYVYAGEVPRVWAMELWRGNKDAATKRAIVRAAAEVGKNMP